MKNKILRAAIILIISVFIFYLYTFLHEGGHALVGLISNGRVDKMTLGLNAHVYISGARFNPFSEALNNISGVLLPVIFLTILLVFYNRNGRNSIIHTSYILLYFFVVGSLLAWLFVPLLSLFKIIPGNDDISKFLNISGLHPIILSSVTSFIFCFLLYFGSKKGLFIKVQELMNEPRSGMPSGVSNFFNKKSILYFLLGLTLLLGYLFFIRQSEVLRTSFSLEASSSMKDMRFPFEITKSRVYNIDLNLKTMGILVDTQLYNESGQLIYHIIGEQVTLNKPLDLKKGSYSCLLTFMADATEMKEHFRINGYPLEEERIKMLERIFNKDLNMKRTVNYSAIIR